MKSQVRHQMQRTGINWGHARSLSSGTKVRGTCKWQRDTLLFQVAVMFPPLRVPVPCACACMRSSYQVHLLRMGRPLLRFCRPCFCGSWFRLGAFLGGIWHFFGCPSNLIESHQISLSRGLHFASYPCIGTCTVRVSTPVGH